MGKINIDIEALNESISSIQSLQNRWTTDKKKLPSKVGGGGTIDEMDLIAEAYENLDKNINTLLTSTVSFFENVRDSFISADSKSMEMFEKE